jgi:7,8-dihydropterin-6-yl-methyl-4-(beta-D-ribofuranosyl)aminobenzene 5'-phosphate synthase
MSLTVTTLIENSPGEHKGLATEHGLCFHVAAGETRLLFDTGQSGAILDNAARLRIDLSRLDHVILSHGHYDHSGGLRRLARECPGFSLTVGRGFFDEKFGDRGHAREFLGNNFGPAFLEEAGIPWSYLDEPVRGLAPGVRVLTGFPRVHPGEKVNPRFTVRRGGAMQPDDFSDEVLVALDSPKGLVILLGCSHPGVCNMLDAVKARLGGPIHAVLGGAHLVEADRPGLDAALSYFEESGIAVIGLSHCTGDAAMGELGRFADRFYHNRTGSVLDVS